MFLLISAANSFNVSHLRNLDSCLGLLFGTILVFSYYFGVSLEKVRNVHQRHSVFLFPEYLELRMLEEGLGKRRRGSVWVLKLQRLGSDEKGG